MHACKRTAYDLCEELGIKSTKFLRCESQNDREDAYEVWTHFLVFQELEDDIAEVLTPMSVTIQ